MLGIAYSYQLTPQYSVRASGSYFGVDFDGVIDEPFRLGIDIIWDF
jgi:hypothetical protein